MRDAFLDTTKAVLIFLVVFGHFVERLMGWQGELNHGLLSLIYLIHMPAFIFISGMLFKDQNCLKNVLFFLSLYLPFQCIYLIFSSVLSGHAISIGWNVFERPYWILWYLMGMMAWTLITHVLIKTSYPVFLALVMSVGVGLLPWNNYDYSVGRIFVFLPFFVLGAVYGKQLMTLIKRPIQQVKRFAFMALVLVILLSLFLKLDLSQYWLYGSLSYQQLKVEPWLGVTIRLGCLALSSVGCMALFYLIRAFGERWTHLGRYTLPVYLLHGLVVMGVAQVFHSYALFDRLTQALSSIWAWPLSICLIVLLSWMTCWLLQQPIFDRILRLMSLWLMKPYTLLKTPQPTSHKES